MVPPLFMDVQPHHAVRAWERRRGEGILRRVFCGVGLLIRKTYSISPVSGWNDSPPPCSRLSFLTETG